MDQIDQWGKQLDRLEARHAAAVREACREQGAVREAVLTHRAALKTRHTLQGIAEAVQAASHRDVAGLVSRCLSAVFDAPYTFHIKFVQKRGKTEANFSLERDGVVLDDPLGMAGGGVADVAGFALRLARVALARPPVRRLMVLDEPFRHLSAEYRPRAAKMLEELAEELDFQLLIVTHDREFQIGKVVEL